MGEGAGCGVRDEAGERAIAGRARGGVDRLESGLGGVDWRRSLSMLSFGSPGTMLGAARAPAVPSMGVRSCFGASGVRSDVRRARARGAVRPRGVSLPDAFETVRRGWIGARFQRALRRKMRCLRGEKGGRGGRAQERNGRKTRRRRAGRAGGGASRGRDALGERGRCVFFIVARARHSFH